MATIKDVAKLSGVSATTVSIIITGKAEERHISKETQDRVLAVMKEVSYQPNLSARRLRFQDTAKPIIAFFWPLDYRTSILASFLNSLQKELKAQDFDCEFIVQAFQDDALEKDASSIIKNSYNAVVIGAASNNDIKYLESINPTMPIILINRDSEKFSTVCTDNREIGFQAARVFKSKGYAEVGVISSDHPYLATGMRTQAFLYACSQLGIHVDLNHVIKGESTITGGSLAAEQFCRLSNPPKAIFFESDSMAIGALSTFHKQSIRIPEDVEILSISMLEAETTTYTIPALSVIEMPNAQISKLIIQTVKNMLTNNESTPVHHTVNAEVILRDSLTPTK